ncbi:hypothetical protein H0E87_010514, partial [Populus deltoides]
AGVRLRRGTLAGVYGAAATVSWRLGECMSTVLLLLLLLTVLSLSFMAETGDNDGAAEDFADVALVHHAGAELLLEDDLLQLLLLCDVGVALSAGPKRRSCCWS